MLKKGSIIRGKLIEKVDSSHWIVSFQGQLIQVKNSTGLKFQENQQMSLQVESLDPLQLKLLGPDKGSKKLDIFV